MTTKSKFLQFFKRYDFSIIIIVTIIFFVGCLNLYSATSGNSDPHLATLYRAQILWFLLSMGIAFIVSFIHPKNFARFSWFFYLINLLLLVLVLLFGKIGMGAQRWIAFGPIRFQPSETMKIALVLALSRWFSKVSPDKALTLKTIIIPALFGAIPAVLVMAQPDLGTGLLMFLVLSVMVFYRQLKWKSIGIIAIVAMVSGLFMYNFGLKEYQKKRILTFIDPYADAKGSGYNAIQSEIAIGSGRLLGKGFKKSSQASLQYLPENHTDFVFAVFNEEHGFIGSLFLVTLYVILLLRLVWLSTVVTKLFDSIVVIGLMSIIFWHTLINMSMVMGLMPIVGIPLPFMSYGGSSLITFGLCVGFLTSISNTRSWF